MKKSKMKCKILSMFLVSLFLIQLLPLQVAAENVTEAIAHKDFLESALENPVTENNTNDEHILYEIEEKRDEYTKVYKKSDGTYTAVMTETPLHYFNAGVWEEINNAMILDGDFYTNTENLFNVSLPESINSTESLTVENEVTVATGQKQLRIITMKTTKTCNNKIFVLHLICKEI